MEERMKVFVCRMMPILDERQSRVFLGALSEAMGHGSAKELAELTGKTPQTITAGRKAAKEISCDPTVNRTSDDEYRVRRPGGGRKSALENQPGLEEFIKRLLEHNTLGLPQNHLLWTTLSAMDISLKAAEEGFKVSDTTVIKILNRMDVSLQKNKKYVESGKAGPFRNFQFNFINLLTDRFIRDGCPVISIDAKKKELLGNYKNNGSEYRPKGEPRKVNDHDFPGKEGKAVPYGIYDVGKNEGFVSVGISSDTAEFAVNAIKGWWDRVGINYYADAPRIMVTADCGGSNGRRNRLWKLKLQEFADYVGKEIYVCHLPPGTSKWNKIEHRMFSHISIKWRGQPLVDLQTVVDLIGEVKTSTGLKITSIPDTNEYLKGIKVTKEDVETLEIDMFKWTDGWDYRVRPRTE